MKKKLKNLNRTLGFYFLKNLNSDFLGFYFLKNLKNLGFLKPCQTALVKSLKQVFNKQQQQQEASKQTVQCSSDGCYLFYLYIMLHILCNC